MLSQFSHVGPLMEKPNHTSAELLTGGVVDGRVRSPMDTRRVDWAFDAPIPCQTCHKEAVAKIAVLKARNTIICLHCGTAIDLTDAGMRAFVEEMSRVIASICSLGGYDG
jgi:transcription elongation factor Elf1